MNERQTREGLRDACLLLRGNPAVWGGEDETADCSGVVRTIRRVVGLEERGAPDYASRDIWRAWPKVGPADVGVGDLALYGWPLVSHVMVVTGGWYWRSLGNGVSEWCVPVCGASGARRWIRTVELARKHGAQVKDFASHRYRWDFRGFRTHPEFGKQGVA